MTVETIIGKSAEDIATLLADNWPQWVTQQPQLAVVPEPSRLSVWLAQADPPARDQVMRGLAFLAAEDGADSCDAAYVLAWLMLPVATMLAAELSRRGTSVDFHVAAQLWIEVRSFPWRTHSRVAANIAWRLRRRVLLEIGDAAETERSDRIRANTVLSDENLDDWPSLDPARSPEEELIEYLADGVIARAITQEEGRLLLTLVQVEIEVSSSVPRAVATGATVTEAVAPTLNVSARTVRRRASRAIQRLAQHVRGDLDESA